MDYRLGWVVEQHHDDPEQIDACEDMDNVPGRQLDRIMYGVTWEGGVSEVVSSDDLLQWVLPVHTATGRPVVAFMDTGKYEGQVGIIISVTSKMFRLRLLPEINGQQGAYYPIARQIKHNRATGECRLELYDTPRLNEVVHLHLTSEVRRLLTDVLRAKLAPSTGGRVHEFLHLTNPCRTTGDMEWHLGLPMKRKFPEGYINGHVIGARRDSAGRMDYIVQYDDGDEHSLSSFELADSVDWDLPAPDPPDGLRPTRSVTIPPPADVVEVAPKAAGPSRPPATSLAGLVRELSNYRVAMAAAPRIAQTPGTGSTPRTAGSSTAASTRAPGTAGPTSKFLAQPVFEELLEELTENMDTRTKAAYKQAYPARNRGLPSLESWADKRLGAGLVKEDHQFRNRWPKITLNETHRLQLLASRFGSVKQSTLSTYSSNRVGFQQFCASCTPAREPYPLKADTITMWLLARYKKGLKSNASNTKPLISSLTHHTTNVLAQYLDVPYPGMAISERLQLRRAIRALSELEDLAIRRSIPLTVKLLRLLLREQVVQPKSQPVTRDEIETLRDVARYGLNRVCMLRKNDVEDNKQQRAHYKRVRSTGGCAAKMFIPPGKSHCDNPYAVIPDYVHHDGDAASDCWLHPGYAMNQWLAFYRQQLGPGRADDQQLPLFPTIDERCQPTARVASSKKFQDTMRRWTRSVGLPEEFCVRVTLHGFRSGGCTDAINAGMDIYQIMEQGRWSSRAVEMYMHLRAGLVRTSLADVVRRAGLIGSERKQLSTNQQQQQLMLKTWYDDYQKIAVTA